MSDKTWYIAINGQQQGPFSLQELLPLLKARPGDYNYASSGNGTILHLAAEMFIDEAGVTMKHIPYKGVGPMTADLIGGQVELGVLAVPAELELPSTDGVHLRTSLVGVDPAYLANLLITRELLQPEH